MPVDDEHARLSVSAVGEPPSITVIEVVYPAHRGTIGLRGSTAPLSWEETMLPSLREGDHHVFHLPLPPGTLLELKLVRNDDDWAGGRNHAVHAGDHLFLEPWFDIARCRLEPAETLEHEGAKLSFEVLLPPSYDEQEGKLFPVIYAQDAQALWSTSQDPFGIWSLDTTLDQLYEIGAMEQVIVVAIDTSERRVDRLSPVPDPQYGGGAGKKHLNAIVDGLCAHVNKRYRTRPGREHTALLGSSMGGLFSFYAAWSRPEIFGKAACLSSSFWWADRHAVRWVQGCPAPETRPVLYIDSGVARSALERDSNAKDGFHHTRSMFRALVTHGYVPGVDLHRLSFPGLTHDATSWASRIAIPLQLLFPPEVKRSEHVWSWQ